MCVAAAVLIAACARDERAGRLTAEWSSTDTTIGTGQIAASANASWCRSTGQLKLLAMGTDSGVAVLYRSDAVRGGEYPIVDTTTSRAPSALVAVRFVQGIKVLALSSDSGTLTLDPGDGSRVTGRFNAWFRESGTASPVEVRGQFSGIPVVPDSSACAPPSSSSDTSRPHALTPSRPEESPAVPPSRRHPSRRRAVPPSR